MKLYDTMIDLLDDARSRDRRIRFIDGDDEESALSFAELYDSALGLLGALHARGLDAGDELVIFTNSNRQFVIAFWAAILGGIIPVPVAVGISDEHRFKLFRILRQLKHGSLLTGQDLLARLKEFAREQELADVSEILKGRALTGIAGDDSAPGEIAQVAPGALAFIQYSSGSTSDPKGVCLTHRNLCHNIRAIVEGTGWQEDDNSLSWMQIGRAHV